MSDPVKHHFIPVFFLKNWTTADGTLVEYSRPRPGKIVHRNIGAKGTGFVERLYSFPDCPPELRQALEREFMRAIDTLASKALKKLLSPDNGPWSPELRSAWSRFVINLLIRHPHPFAEVREYVHDCWQEVDETTERQYLALRKPDDPLNFAEWILQQRGSLADRVRMDLLRGIMDNEPAGTRLNAMIWHVIDVSMARFELLASDWPLYRLSQRDRRLWALPLGPHKLFTAVSHPELYEDLARMDPTEVVRRINGEVVSRARLYVYGSNTAQERFIANRMSTNQYQPPFFPTLSRD